jgi:dipeptidyl aminopeptidase/acylaminoacyl peptidase
VLHLTLALASLLALPNASAAPTSAAAPGSVEAVFESLERVHHFHDASISADGKRAVWSVKAREGDGPERLGLIYVAELPSGTPRRITAAKDGKPHRELGAVLSPDGQTIAFLSDALQPRQAQIWVVAAAGGAPRQLTRAVGQFDHLRWSPDGRAIAALFVEGSSQEPGALVAYKPDSGLVEETLEEQRIAVIDARSGRLRQVSPADLYVYDYDWSSDGRLFAAEAAKGSGTNNYWLAELYTVEAASGKTRSIWKPALQIACPRFSPDNRTIAVIHGIMSDEGSTGGDVWVVPTQGVGGEAKNLTPGMKASATTLHWRSPQQILFTEKVDGEEGVAAVDDATGKIFPLWSGPESLHDFAISQGPRSVVVLDSFTKPPEVYAGAVGKWKAVSALNAKAQRFWGEAKSLHWQSDGASVQGWLLSPQDFDASRRYPMVVHVHGGPSSMQGIGWPTRWSAVLPSQGYFVFLPNPRGSYGFGEAFTAGNVKDFGGGDLRDILTGVDAVLKAAPVDPSRLGITGWSYGGYMTMWAVTQTQRFKAAVAGAGIASWQSYYGQNKIDTWMLPFFGASVYEDPKVYAKSSPMEFILNVKTPTLVLHGDRDSEVPTPQGYEFWHALKALGVPTQLAIYTDEGHDVRQPAHRLDILKRTVEWFDKYLK